MMCRAVLMVLVIVFSPMMTAQEKESAPDADTRMRDLEAQVKQLREDLDKEKQERERDDILRTRAFTLYGDIGLRWQAVTTDGKRSDAVPGEGEFSRPEYRVRLGVAGYAFDSDKHRFKYDVRISNSGEGEFNAAPLGAPAVGWRPFDALGSSADIVFDRWHINHTYKQFLRGGGGRFGSIFKGTQLVFDEDVGLTGVYGICDIGTLAGLHKSRSLDDWGLPQSGESEVLTKLQLRAALYYLAQKNTGLPTQTAERLPHGLSLQIPAKLWLENIGVSVFVVPGFHYIEGEEAIAGNVGTGYTSATTNSLGADGNVASEFRTGELYVKALLFEDRIASLSVYSHYAHNFGAIVAPGAKDEQARAIVAGVEWGAVEFQYQGDFRLSYSYQYIEADAVIPEFNHDVYNTNYTGHMVSLEVNILPSVSVFAAFYYGWRVDESLNGVGRNDNGDPGAPSNDHETRMRAGIIARF